MKYFIQQTLKSKLVIYGIFLASVALTLLLYIFSLITAKKQYLDEFEVNHIDFVSSIEKKLDVYEQVIWAGVALFNSSDSVSRKEWRSFSKILDINTHWPGVQALGYSKLVKKEDKATHEKLVQSEGFVDYAIYPSTEDEFYTPIIYIEPFDWRNQRAFGYDMWTNIDRREAMNAAALYGTAHATAPITLVQEVETDLQIGFLIYVPVYSDDRKLDKRVPRSIKDVEGWVYAPFRMNDLMLPLTTALPAHTSLLIEDIESASSRNIRLLSDTEKTRTLFNLPASPSKNSISQSEDILMFGRQWRITLSQPSFSPLHDAHNGNLAFALFSILIDLFLLVILSSYRRSQLRQDELFKEKYRSLITSLNEKTHLIDTKINENFILEKNVATLQDWLEQRELRISELKLNQKEAN